MARKERIRIFVGDTDEHIKAQHKKISLFKPHNLQSQIREARASRGDSGLDQAVVLVLKRHNQLQLVDLLRRLGIDPLQSDACQRGFLELACLHYGVGRLALHHSRTNRNPAKWTPKHDLELLREVTKLKATGISELQAVKQIVSNPKTRRLFPYGEKNRTGSHYSVQNENQKREAALRRHLQHLKSASNESSILNQLLGPGWNAQGDFERFLHAFDFIMPLPKSVVKNGRSSR
jgi:hypothetical protein